MSEPSADVLAAIRAAGLDPHAKVRLDDEDYESVDESVAPVAPEPAHVAPQHTPSDLKPPKTSWEIAGRIVKRRRRLGIRQEELARRLGVTQQQVVKWEKARATPKPATRRRIERALHMREGDLGTTNDVPLARLASALKESRYEDRMSQADLADCIGMSERWVRQIESGRYAPSAAALTKLRPALEASDAGEALLEEIAGGVNWTRDVESPADVVDVTPPDCPSCHFPAERSGDRWTCSVCVEDVDPWD